MDILACMVLCNDRPLSSRSSHALFRAERLCHPAHLAAALCRWAAVRDRCGRTSSGTPDHARDQPGPRDIARQTAVLDERRSETTPERREILTAIIGFAHASVGQLRQKTLARQAGEPALFAEPADRILHAVALQVGRLLRQGRLRSVEALGLNDSLSQLTQALVGCERLSNTPLPFAYTLLLHRTAYLFCFLLPFGLADMLGWATPLAAMLVAYTFFGLDALGEELEEPFGMLPNSLPISAFATMIEIHLRSAMGETDLPPVPVPTDYVLT